MTEASVVEGDQRGAAALITRNLAKQFAGTIALRGLDLSIERGEILALLGGNGSGKSTLIKLLAGVYKAEAGSIQVGDTEIGADHWSPAHARRAKLHFVHQSLGLFPNLTVAENLAIGRGFECTRWPTISWRRTAEHARGVLEQFHIDAEPGERLRELRPSQQTMIAIARVLQDEDSFGDAVLFLDEPTASLPVDEVDHLHEALHRYSAAGQTIVYVSHRLDEIHDLADRVAIMRDGELVAIEAAERLSERDLVAMISGDDRAVPSAKPVGDPVGVSGDAVVERTGHVRSAVPRLEVRGLRPIHTLNKAPAPAVDLKVFAGEIVGLAGLLGSGRSAVLRSIFGAQPHMGPVIIDGELKFIYKPSEAIDVGLGFIPEDRAADAMFDQLSVTLNLSAAVVPQYWERFRLRRSHEHVDARQLTKQFRVKTKNERAKIRTLSGGNQQKVLLARWIRRRPRVLLLDEPSQGVDVAARADIHEQLVGLAAEGTAILVVSSDLAELASLCDRVLVLNRGHITAQVHRPFNARELNELVYLDKTKEAS